MQFDHIHIIDPITGAASPLELPKQKYVFPNAKGGLRRVKDHTDIISMGEEAGKRTLAALQAGV